MVHNRQLPWSILASTLTYDNRHYNMVSINDKSEHNDIIEDFADHFKRCIQEEIKDSNKEFDALNQKNATPDNTESHEIITTPSARAVDLGLQSLDKTLFDKVTTDRRKLGKLRTEPRLLHKAALDAVQRYIIHNEMEPLLEAAVENTPNLLFLWNIPDWAFHFFGPGWSEVMRFALTSYMCLTVFDVMYEENPALKHDYRSTGTFVDMITRIIVSRSDVAAEPHRVFYCVPRRPRLSLNGDGFHLSTDVPTVDEESTMYDPLIDTNRERLEHYLQFCWDLLKRCDMVARALGRRIDWESEIAQCARQLWGGVHDASEAIIEKREPINIEAKLIQVKLEKVQKIRPTIQKKRYWHSRRVDRMHRAGERSGADSNEQNVDVEKLKEKLDASSARGKRLEAEEESLQEKIRDLTQSLYDLVADWSEDEKYLGPSCLFQDSKLI